MILPFQHERSTSMLILMAMGTRQELEKVTGWREAFREKVHVIGHHAVGMNRECVGEQLRAQVVEKPLRTGWIEEDFLSVFAAEGEEKPGGADVAIEWQADVFVTEHAWRWRGL